MLALGVAHLCAQLCTRCVCRCWQEFRRLESSLGAARDRAELLGASEGAPLLSVQVQTRIRAHKCVRTRPSLRRGRALRACELGPTARACGRRLVAAAHEQRPPSEPPPPPGPPRTPPAPPLRPPPTTPQVHNAGGALLRERTQIAASTTYVDEMLAQAQSVTRGLFEQRRVFDGVQDKLMSVGERFPAVNGLLNAIRRKKSKVRSNRCRMGCAGQPTGGRWCAGRACVRVRMPGCSAMAVRPRVCRVSGCGAWPSRA